MENREKFVDIICTFTTEENLRKYLGPDWQRKCEVDKTGIESVASLGEESRIVLGECLAQEIRDSRLREQRDLTDPEINFLDALTKLKELDRLALEDTKNQA